MAIRPGATGTAIAGFEVRIVDDRGATLPPGESSARWRCAGSRAAATWTIRSASAPTCATAGTTPGDVYRMDEDGYFWYQARADDMIISAGYNIAGPEVEARAARPSARP